ncbi:YbfB/YjiJ family MFS transporter [Geovibrio thiophilus]|nr:YbfB/YjiJ family MFS transporter [Geovibrio thiophilus]
MKHYGAVLLGGAAAMFTAMGIGRFAYTPAITFMLEAGALNTAQAGFIASANFAGYLAGAVYYSISPPKKRTFEISLALSVLTTAAMPVFDGMLWWSTIRFFSGFYSAAVFVCAAEKVYTALYENMKQTLGGFLFSGIGAGIAFSSWAVPFASHYGGWRVSWYFIGAVCTLTALTAVWLSGGRSASARRSTEVDNRGLFSPPMLLLAFAYLLEGSGYIIAGTFLVDIIKLSSGSSGAGFTGWALAGGTAVFSNFLWSWAGHRFGLFRVLFLLLMLQAAGMLLPVFSNSISAAYLFSIIFGGTFLGAVTLALACGRHIMPKGNTAPFLTVFFGIGQIISPWIGGLMAYKSGSFAAPLIFSSANIIVGAALTALAGTVYIRRKKCRS